MTDTINCPKCQKEQPVRIDLSWSHWDGRSFRLDYDITCEVCGHQVDSGWESILPWGV